MKKLKRAMKTTLKGGLRLLLSAAMIAWQGTLGVGVSSVQAAPPSVTHFQGRLTDASNNPLSGAQNFDFEIYDAAAAGTLLWSETQNGVNVINGVFNVELGAATPLTPDVFRSGAAYLRVVVNGTPMSPRERLATSPFSFNTAMLDGRDYAHFVTTSTIQTIAGDKTFTGQVFVPTPTVGTHAANKSYVDAAAVGSSGWTKTGAVVALTNATDNAVVQTTMTVKGTDFSVGGTGLVVTAGKAGVGVLLPAAAFDVNGDAQFGSGATKSTFTALGALNMAANTNITLSGTGIVTGLPLPSANADAANKQYVDAQFSGGSSGWLKAGSVLAPTSPGDNVVVQSTLTVQGNQFSVGASTFVVRAGRIGVGVAAPNSTMNINGGVNIGPTNNTIGAGNLFVEGSVNVGNTVFVNTLYSNTGNDVTFGNTGKVTVSGTSLGVGTSAGAAKLDVNGDAQFGSGVAKSTFSATGALTMAANASITLSGTGKVTGLPAPSAGSDAANKAYVDTNAGGWTKSGAVIALTNATDNAVVQSSLTVQGGAVTIGGPNTNSVGLLLTRTNGGVDATAHDFISANNAPWYQRLWGGSWTGERQGNALTANAFYNVAAPASSYAELGFVNTAGGFTLSNMIPSVVMKGQQVGIATSLPAANLDVNGNAQFGSGAVKSTFTATGALTIANNASITLSGTGKVTGLPAPTVGSDAANKTYVDTNAGGWTRTGAQVALTNGGDAVTMQSTVTVQGNQFSVGGSTLVVTAGRVGFGTASPLNRVQIGAGAGASVFANQGLYVNETGWGQISVKGVNDAEIGMLAGTSAVFGTFTNHDLELRTNNTPRAVLTTGGSLGVGATAPSTKLDVNGDAQFGSGVSKSTFSTTGALTMASNATITLSGTGKVTGLPTPSAGSDAANKSYVDSQVAGGGSGWIKTGNVVALTSAGDYAVVQSSFTTYGPALITGTLTASGGVTGNVTGALTGNATTATALAANGANCGAGNSPLGVDASGAAEGCYDVATQAELDAHVNATTAHGSTSANTASAIVQRDASGNFSAGTITAALSGNATTATTGTNLAAGGVGTIPYQSAAGATAMLPNMASGGIVVGNGAGIVPSTATLQGTGSQVTVTKSATAITLSLPATINVNTSGNAATATQLAANGANCTAGNSPLGVDVAGAAEGCFDVATQAELDAHTTATTAHGSTSANTASAIVQRDGSGNFAAGTITAALSGNATTATALAANGGNCSAGNSPLGVDASGAAEGCYDVATQAELDAHTTATTAHGSTSANTASAIVQRDASGNFSAGTITASLNGNANTATSATGASNVSGGAVGNVPYQSGASATAFLPTMASGGIVVGNGAGVIPSTAALQGTASQVTITKSATAVTLSLPATINVNTSGNAGTATALAANGANCSAGNSPLGVDASGGAEGCYDVATQAELDAHTTATTAHGSTSANTASAIVQRDASGNFSAGTITANLTGNASGNAGTATALAANGANCGAGNSPLGVDASGAAEGCYDVATQAELDAHVNGTSVHSATNLNTASRIVMRDASGNFAAGTVTAALSGNATTATALAANGANCGAGNSPLGVDASGAAEGCYDVATQAELDAHTTATTAHGSTSANTASTIVQRDASGNFTAGTVTASLSGTATYSTYAAALDDRTIAPNEISANVGRFGFTSWANNNTLPYADYWHMRSYGDSSGGNDNLVMWRKDQIGMRIWQQTFGSATAYASFKDVALANSQTTSYLPKWNATGGYLDNSQVYDNGTNVGVNQAGPNAKLTVTGNTILGANTAATGAGASDVTVSNTVFFGTGGSYKVTNGGAATIAASSVGDLTKNGNTFHLGNAGGSGAGADEYVFWHGATGSGTRLASIRGNGAGQGMFAQAFTPTGTPDLAEYMMAEKGVEAADVVAASEQGVTVAAPGGETFQVRKSNKPYERAILGVIADGTSAFTIQSHMHDIDKRHPGRPLVLAGRVPVKVTLENGPIHKGDYLTSSSKPGYAMRATDAGNTVGIALEDFEGGDVREGKVLCFVHIGERNNAEKIRELEERLERLESLVKPFGGGGR